MMDFASAENLISVSAGKDSTVTMALSIAREIPNCHYVFADTQHEHQAVYDYLAYLEDRFGRQIQRVKADFTARLLHKQTVVRGKWVNEGSVTPAEAEAICQLLVPSGNAFLDLCMEKGRFPSTKARFCSQELKHRPIHEQVTVPLLADGREVISWQGVRADESEDRKDLKLWEDTGDLYIYRPVLRWTAADIFRYHSKHKIRPNPLYLEGMSRVGCMPCVNARKDELRQIADRFPAEIARVAAWERIVGLVSKRGNSTFFHAGTDPLRATRDNNLISTDSHGIYNIIEWSKTVRGGRQFDLLQGYAEAGTCSSMYGLCE